MCVVLFYKELLRHFVNQNNKYILRQINDLGRSDSQRCLLNTKFQF